MKKRIRGPVVAVMAALGIVLAAAAGPTVLDSIRHESSSAHVAYGAPLPGSVSFADVVQRALPSVVNVSSTRVIKTSRMIPFFQNPFFRSPNSPFRQWHMPQQERERSLGSGVIVSANGYILTNNHVVKGSKDIRVGLSDGRDFDAKIVGTDPKSDIAVLRLVGHPKGLRPIQFGDSQALRLGDVVLAIGDPFGVGQTVTMGIVSAKGRSNVGIEDYEDFIQTDAAINPGNSGGALINTRGQLVGINTAILSRSGGYQGIGFAIPTNMAKPIMTDLEKTGHVVRGWLGVSIQNVTDDLAKALHLSVRRGVLVTGVVPGSPASKAGFKRDDVITRFDGRPTKTAADLRNMVAVAGAHKPATVGILRGNQHKTIHVTLGLLKGNGTGRGANSPSASQGSNAKLGVVVGNVDADTQAKYNLPATLRGAVVLRVVPGSTAAQIGLRPGDVILRINRQPVNSGRDFARLYRHAKSTVALLIYRHGASVYITIPKD